MIKGVTCRVGNSFFASLSELQEPSLALDRQQTTLASCSKEYEGCCVFLPAFGCCTHPKVGAVFKLFFLF